jgi:hypothetical protein
MTPKLDSKIGTSLQVTSWMRGTTNSPAGIPDRTHRQLVEESRTRRIDSSNVAVLNRFGREIFPRQPKPIAGKLKDATSTLNRP